MVKILGKTINSVIGIGHNDLDGEESVKLTPKYLKKIYDLPIAGLFNVGNHEVDNTILEVLPTLTKETLLVITDVSPSEKVAEAIEEKFADGYLILLFDHHKTALALNQYEWATVMVSDEQGVLECGASLYFKFLLEQLPPRNEEETRYVKLLAELIELVRAYDTWDWFNVEPKNMIAKHINTLYYKKGAKEYGQWIQNRFDEILNAGEDAFSLDELSEYIISSEEARFERYTKKKTKAMQIRSYKDLKFGLVTVEDFHSELGNVLALNHPELDFIALVDMDAKSADNPFEKVSLRTAKDTLDVSAIAKSYGGGGHPKAAGFLLSKSNYEIFSPMGLPIKLA